MPVEVHDKLYRMTKIYIYDTQAPEKVFFSSALASLNPVYVESPISQETISPDAEVISVFVSSKVTREFIEMMPKLTLIATRSTGFDHIDMAAAEEKGITVVFVPSYGEHTVAEYAFGLLLGLSRRIPEAVTLTKETPFVDHKLVRGFDLFGKTLGVVGAGRIGKKMITIAKGFGMNVIVYDPFEDSAAAEQLGFRYVPIEEIFTNSDVITLHVPATGNNFHLLNREAFSKMKQGVYIINTSRGELIDTQALIEALKEGKVGGAGLDVCEGEELLKKSSSVDIFTQSNNAEALKASVEISMLKEMPNVLLTPHIAYNTVEALLRICATTSENITGFLEGNISNRVEKVKKVFGTLILVRHTESEWNAKGIWTGSRDAHLTDKGFQDARLLGELITDIHIGHAYASLQVRTMETLSSMLGTMRQPTVSITRDRVLNERDYGEYTGKNKHDMKEILGEEMFEKVRRGWDVAIPQGETLKMVNERVVPYYLSEILPRVKNGENVLVVSHGNALRALIKYIESLSDEAIENTEMMFGGVVMYTINEEGKSLSKEERKTPSVSYDHV